MPKRLSPREQLAQHMEDRRVELGRRWADVAMRGETTTETLRQARVGDGEIRPLTRRAIERGLEWEGGSVTEILNGGAPTPVPRVVAVEGGDSDLRHVAAIVQTLSEDEAARVAQMLERRMSELKATKLGKPT